MINWLSILSSAHILISTNFLSSLAEIESGNDPRKIGKKGEVSAYQFMPKVWKSYWNIPYKPCFSYSAAEVAKQHAQWLSLNFAKRYGRLPNALELYAMWNLGFTKFTRRYEGRLELCPKSTQDAAMRLRSIMLTNERN